MNAKKCDRCGKFYDTYGNNKQMPFKSEIMTLIAYVIVIKYMNFVSIAYVILKGG